MKTMGWSTEQASRFQEFLNRLDVELSDKQLAETQSDFIDYEEDEEIMTFDTFKERVRARL